MAYQTKYRLEWFSESGESFKIDIQKDGYSGNVLYRNIGGAPTLSMSDGNSVKCTSLYFLFETVNDSDINDLYVTGKLSWRVLEYKNNLIVWSGFIVPELLTVDYSSHPNNVSVTCSDSISTLKDIPYPTQDNRVNVLSIIRNCLQCGTIELPIAVQSGLTYVGLTASQFFGSAYVHDSCFNGMSCYDVLEGMLMSFNAFITQRSGMWLVARWNDFDSQIRIFDFQTLQQTSTTSATLLTIGAPYANNDLYPVGSLSLSFKPAVKNLLLSQQLQLTPINANPYCKLASGWTTYVEQLEGKSGAYVNTPNASLGHYYYDMHGDSKLGSGNTGWTFSLRKISQIIRGVKQRSNAENYTFSLKYFLEGIVDFDEYPSLHLEIKLVPLSQGAPTRYLSEGGQWETSETDIHIKSNYKFAQQIREQNWEEYEIGFVGFPVDGNLSISIWTDYSDECRIAEAALSLDIEEEIKQKSVLYNATAVSDADAVDLLVGDFPNIANIKFVSNGLSYLQAGTYFKIETWNLSGDQTNRDFFLTIASDLARQCNIQRKTLKGILRGPSVLSDLYRDALMSNTMRPVSYEWNQLEDEIDITLIEVYNTSVSYTSISDPVSVSGSSTGGTSGGGVGYSRWGSIIGTIDDQIDLKDKLDKRPESEDVKKITVAFAEPGEGTMEEGEFCIVLENED